MTHLLITSQGILGKLSTVQYLSYVMIIVHLSFFIMVINVYLI